MNTDPLLDKTPPHNIDTEESVLCSLFIDNRGFDEIYIAPEDFYKGSHQIIFKAMLALRNKKEPVDLVTIGHYLQDNNELDAIGGGLALARIAESSAMALNIGKYAEDIKSLSVRRELIVRSSEIIGKALSSTETCDEVLSFAQSSMLGVQNTNTSDTIKPVGAFLYNELAEIERCQVGKDMRSMTIGLPFIDRVLTIRPDKGDLIYIAAQTSVGKTSFALSIAKRFSELYNQKVAFLSLEMEMSPLNKKLLAIEADVNNMNMDKPGAMSQDEFGRLSSAADRLAKIPLYIDDMGRNIEDVKRICRKLKKDEFGAIFIDQMSHIPMPGAKSELERYTYNSNHLAMLKKELRMPIFPLSQLTRTADEYNPVKWDLKHSGALENDADAIILLSKLHPTIESTTVRKPKGKGYLYQPIKINCAKNRNGAIGFDAGDYFVINRGMFLLN